MYLQIKLKQHQFLYIKVNNTLTNKIMNKVSKVTALIMLVLVSAVVVLSINLVNCHTANKQLKKTVLMQANQISEMDSIASNHTTMYVGLVK